MEGGIDFVVVVFKKVSLFFFFSQLRKSSSEQTPWKKCEDKFTFPHT